MLKKILIVDDELDSLHLTSVKLRKNGMEVIEASNGEDGLKAALEMHPDLVLLDIILPEIDGFKVASTIKGKLGNNSPIIVMLSALGQESDIVRGYEVGALEYITKPFSPRDLVFRVNQLLNSACA